MERFSSDQRETPDTSTAGGGTADSSIPDNSSTVFVQAWDQEAAADRAAATRVGAFRFAREFLQVALIALVLFVGTRTVVQGREVRGPSMQPAYHSGQRLFVTRYFFHDPRRGDVVVFHPTAPGRDDYIKRVIGVPGDRVAIRNGRVYVNGGLLEEDYLPDAVQTNCAGGWCDVTLGPNQYFVMGDNRPNSSDSRMWGPVEGDAIVGKAWLLYFPFSDFGLAP